MGRATAIFSGPAPWGPGEGLKGQISFNINNKFTFKRFLCLTFVCVLTNEIYKTHQTGFSFCSLGHAPGMGLWEAGVPRGGGSKECGISNQRG